MIFTSNWRGIPARGLQPEDQYRILLTAYGRILPTETVVTASLKNLRKISE